MDELLSPLIPGTQAPDFDLPRSFHASVSLRDFRRRPVVLVFYPADWGPVSRDQLILYQDHLSEFGRYHAQLLAISPDHLWSHEAFASSARIEYPLLADFRPRGAVARTYGVYMRQEELNRRALFVIDGAGIIRWSKAFPTAVNPGGHGIITALESLPLEQSE
jgi:peroxiredoxin (alkyl hydroperoxide reductase subunit C)